MNGEGRDYSGCLVILAFLVLFALLSVATLFHEAHP